jgi:two-component system, OmpR family, response regulator RstA
MTTHESIIHCAPIELDLEGFSVTVAGHDVPLTRAEFMLLAEMARHPYRTFDRHALTEAMRKGEHGHDGPVPSPRSMDAHIARLRQKLRAAGVNCIKTMRFVGYRFVPTPSETAERAR